MDGVGTEEGAPAPEAEADQGCPEGAEEEGTVQQDDQGGTALAREEEEAFEPDPVVEIEGDDLEAARTRAANTITRAVRSGRLGRALAAATPPNPPPLDPECLNTPHRPQNLPPHVKLRRPPPPKASTRSLPKTGIIGPSTRVCGMDHLKEEDQSFSDLMEVCSSHFKRQRPNEEEPSSGQQRFRSGQRRSSHSSASGSVDDSTLLGVLARLTLRQEDQLNQLNLDRTFLLFIQAGKSSILPQMLQISKTWHGQREQGKVDRPLRQLMFQSVFEELASRAAQLPLVSVQPPAADAPHMEPNQPREAPQPRQSGFVRLQHAAREPPAQPIPMDTARDSVCDLPDHVWRTRPTREPGGLTVPHPELLVHLNTEIHAMDVDDERKSTSPSGQTSSNRPLAASTNMRPRGRGGT